MTLRGPDVASYQRGIDLAAVSDADFYLVKVTEGATYLDPLYPQWMVQAEGTGRESIWYHFVTVADSAAAQAAWIAKNADPAHAGMLDVEKESGKTPSLKLVCDVIDAAHAMGLRVKWVYLPKWVWREIWDSPDLTPLKARGVHLIASDYPGARGTGPGQYEADGGDQGPGWAPYGGMQPEMWQYTDAAAELGQLIDYNAFRGTAAQLAAICGEPAPHVPASEPLTGVHRTLRLGSGGDDVRALQTLLTNLRFDTQGVDGQYGLRTLAAVEHAQAAWKTAKDGVCGPLTFAALRAHLEDLDIPGLIHPGVHLSLGATGWNVQVLQSALWLLGCDPAGCDGRFGPHTRAALQAFQRSRAIAVDGVAGPETFGCIRQG